MRGVEEIRNWRSGVTITPEIEGGIYHGWSRDIDVLLKEIDRLSMAEQILRKIILGDPHGQAYFDIDMGVVDAHVPHFTDEEATYLRRLQAEVDGAEDGGRRT